MGCTPRLGFDPALGWRAWRALVHRRPSKNETINQCWVNAGPTSTTSDQHWPSIGSMPRDCWAVGVVVVIPGGRVGLSGQSADHVVSWTKDYGSSPTPPLALSSLSFCPSFHNLSHLQVWTRIFSGENSRRWSTACLPLYILVIVQLELSHYGDQTFLQRKHDVCPILVYCWASVGDGGTK